MLTTYFEFGEVLMTSGVRMELDVQEVAQLLAWHGQLKQGELCKEDYEQNRLALKNKERIFSCYMMNGEKYYVITEWDRSCTTVLKPEEYQTMGDYISDKRTSWEVCPNCKRKSLKVRTWSEHLEGWGIPNYKTEYFRVAQCQTEWCQYEES